MDEHLKSALDAMERYSKVYEDCSGSDEGIEHALVNIVIPLVKGELGCDPAMYNATQFFISAVLARILERMEEHGDEFGEAGRS
jgi:hypothetical protein